MGFSKMRQRLGYGAADMASNLVGYLQWYQTNPLRKSLSLLSPLTL